jgi:putative oxidoreductase
MAKRSNSIKWETLAPYFRSILRIAAASMFIMHGTMKLFAFPPRPSGGGRTVDLMSQIGVAGMLEVFGGALILLGLFTRPVAFILAGEMAVAYFQAHYPSGPWPTLNNGELAALYCFLWLYFSAVGPGPWSIDAKWRR